MVVDHLSRVRVESYFEEVQINDEIPDDELCAIENLPWFINIVNYLVITRLLVAWHVRVSTKFIPKVLTLK